MNISGYLIKIGLIYYIPFYYQVIFIHYLSIPYKLTHD